MERLKLNAQLREEKGKEKIKKMRNGGEVPGVVYKKGSRTLSVKINKKELFDVLHTKAGENVLLDLEIKGGSKTADKKTVIIKELQRHPITEQVLHADFKEILLTEAIRVNVPIVAKGTPEGVAKDGGTLAYVLREIEVECLPTQIPERIEVETSHLKIADSIHIKDLILPSGLKVLNDPELIIMSVEAPYVEKPPEVAVAEEVTEPELIKKERKEEEAEEEGAAEKKEEKPPKAEEKQPKQQNQ